MKKRFTSLILAGCLCLSGVYSVTICEQSAYALSIIASVKSISVKKDVIAIGEKVQLELEWSTGAKQELFYKSSDESILTVDSEGVVTGISDGTATVTVSHSNMGTDKTIDITVSSDAEISITYNTSELELGTKLKKYDTLHYDGKSKGSAANIINTKGNYDLAYINIADYVLPFDAEIVGIDGLYIYIAPQIDGITYLDGRTLSVGDTIDRNTHLLCYDYHINKMVFPVFLPKYYGEYVGDGTIKVKDINHEKKTLTLESVDEVQSFVKGDVNDDGLFTIADIVMLQKMLLGITDVNNPNWKTADLCEDGEINVFDLCVMKRELISNTDNKPILTKAELRDIILSKEEFTWSDFEKYQSEDVGSGLYILKYKVDFDGEDIEVYLYITGSDLKKKPEKIYIEVRRDEEEENINIYEFRQQLIDFIDSFNRQDMTMDDVFELSKKGKNLTWSDFENYQHGEDIGSGINIYEFNIADHSDRFTLVVGYSDENSILYARLKSSGSTIDITESSENDIIMFIAEHNPPA